MVPVISLNIRGGICQWALRLKQVLGAFVLLVLFVEVHQLILINVQMLLSNVCHGGYGVGSRKLSRRTWNHRWRLYVLNQHVVRLMT